MSHQELDKILDQSNEKQPMTRRSALKYMGAGLVGTAGIFFGLPAMVQSCFNKTSSTAAKDGKMATRKDKTLAMDVSLLGFGCMRLPLVENGKPDIDQTQAMELIDYAYKHGVNYFDTAYFYHQGLSETFIGKALQSYPRESFFLADKMPTPLIESLTHAQSVFEEQLQKCKVDYFDFYLLHTLGEIAQYERVYEEYGVYRYLLSEKEKGRIKRLGFSFHGKKEDFPYFLDKHPWDFTMIQANYLDWKTDAQYLYNEASRRDIQCIIMEPVRGGMLATLNREAVRILKDAAPDRSPASWAMQYVASLPNVLTVLSGMSNMEQVVDNVNTLTDFHTMTVEEYAVVEQALSAFLRIRPVPCTECQYCMPCPAGVDIPACFHAYNTCLAQNNLPGLTDAKDREYERKKRAFMANMNKIPEQNRPNRCTQCGVCVPHCPQKIAISDKIREMASLYRQLRLN